MPELTFLTRFCCYRKTDALYAIIIKQLIKYKIIILWNG